MTKKQNIIKEISQLYAGISFYYSDFLSLEETIYNNNTGITNNYYSRIRVIEKNTLGEYISYTPIENIKEKLNIALLNSRVSSIFPDKKIRVYYPYIHKRTNELDNINKKNIIKINKKIKNYKNKYKPDFFDFTIKHINKIIVSNVGTVINQDFITVKFTIKLKEITIFKHYKVSTVDDIKFPKISTNKLEEIYDKYNILLSSKVVSKIGLFFLKNNIDILNLYIAPYLYKGVQSNLYDDEGTIRIKALYKELTGGSILNNNDNSSGYYYDFSKNKFILKQPDLEIKSGNKSVKDFNEGYYLLAKDIESINLSRSSKNIEIKAYFRLLNNKKDLGYLIKNVIIPISLFKDPNNITKTTKVIGFEQSSIKAPDIFIGKSYE